MIGTKLIFGEQAIQFALKGMEIVNKAVSATIGAAGRNILINIGGFPVFSTKDGVNVARSINLSDQKLRCGSNLIISAAQQTENHSGDGSSATIILTYETARQAIRHLIAGVDSAKLVKGIEYATKEVIQSLEKMAKPIGGSKDIKSVAYVALNQDEKLSGLISQAVDKVGQKGVISCRKSRDMESSLEFIEGMSLKVGPYNIRFLNPATRERILEDTYVLCYNGHIKNEFELFNVMETIAVMKKKGVVKSLLIFCNESNYSPIACMLKNIDTGALNSCMIRTPGMEDEARLEILEDISLYTGGKVISGFTGSIHNTPLEDLGFVKRVVINKYTTVLFDGLGEKADINERVSIIRKDMEDASDDPVIVERYQMRIARLTTGIAIINVGAATDAELTEKKFRVDDALQSVQCAIQEGIVPGGGVALLRAKKEVAKSKKPSDVDEPDIINGMNILLNSLYAPIRAILSNAGERVDVIIDNLEIGAIEAALGYDVVEKGYFDMYEAGIVDALKVVKESLINASSVACVLIKTQGLIIPEDEKIENK